MCAKPSEGRTRTFRKPAPPEPKLTPERKLEVYRKALDFPGDASAAVAKSACIQGGSLQPRIPAVVAFPPCSTSRLVLCQGRPVGITARQYQQMRERLDPASRRKKPAMHPPCRAVAAAKGPRVVMGVDPSLRGTGYGVIRFERSAPATLAQGTIHCPARWARSRCLALIATTLRDVIRKYQPETCVVEGLFHAQNLQTAILMGEARGAALVAAAEAGLDIFELAPRKVKQAVVGFGGAQKSAVARMVQRLLSLADLPEPDAADALALALAHAQEQSRHRLTAAKPI